MEIIRQGLVLSVYGMGVTFLLLGALIVLIRALLFLFPASPPDAPTNQDAEVSEEERHAAAVAAAWWYLEQRESSRLGARLEEDRGPWWQKRTDNTN